MIGAGKYAVALIVVVVAVYGAPAEGEEHDVEMRKISRD